MTDKSNEWLQNVVLELFTWLLLLFQYKHALLAIVNQHSLRLNEILGTAQMTKPNQLLFKELPRLELNLRLLGTLFRKNKDVPDLPPISYLYQEADNVGTDVYPYYNISWLT